MRGVTFCVRLKKLHCFQFCVCTILAENDAPRAKFHREKKRLKKTFMLGCMLSLSKFANYVFCLLASVLLS